MKIETKLLEKIINKTNKTIIIGYLNATHQKWFCKKNNKNDISLNDFIDKHKLEIINDKTPTFKRSRNIIDLALISQNLIKKHN